MKEHIKTQIEEMKKQTIGVEFCAEKIIFSGIAGNMTSKIGIGDVVIGISFPYRMTAVLPDVPGY